MKARTATVGDLESVFHDLSRRMAIEYIAAGKDTKAAYDNLMMNLREGRAHALLQSDKAVAIIAWNEADGATETLLRRRKNSSTEIQCVSVSGISGRFKLWQAICRSIREAGWTVPTL